MPQQAVSAKNEKLIMVVERELLFGEDTFQGFRPHNHVYYEARILKKFTYMKRGLAEQNPAYKQPIGYSIIVNPALKQVFAYQRSSHDAKYGEKRLQGKWSWGVGGHIDKIDTEAGNPINASMLRELDEEVELGGKAVPKILGYINDDSTDVGSVHFGIVNIFETGSKAVKPKDDEIDNGGMRSIEELEKICSSPDFSVEEWSKISLEPLKQYLQKNHLV